MEERGRLIISGIKVIYKAQEVNKTCKAEEVPESRFTRLFPEVIQAITNYQGTGLRDMLHFHCARTSPM